MDLSTIRNLDDDIVTISAFNKGKAGKIFDEVEHDGHKIVFKNNKRKAIILSPSLYDALIEMLSDQLLLEEAERRIAASKGKEVSMSEMMQRSGMTDKDLEGWEDVEID